MSHIPGIRRGSAAVCAGAGEIMGKSENLRLTEGDALPTFQPSFPMTLNVALIVLIAVVVALVAATTITHGRLAEAKSS
jgi:hypothetical protein